MVRGLLLWAAGNPRLERTITENPILSKATHRFIAGERLDEALEAAAQLNAHGIGGILDLLGEGSPILRAPTKPPSSTSRRLSRLPPVAWTRRFQSNCPSLRRPWTGMPVW